MKGNRMTKSRIQLLNEIEKEIETTEAYLRDLKNERNKLILYSALEIVNAREKEEKGESI